MPISTCIRLPKTGCAASNKVIKRDNHYIPNSYLKRWADDEGVVWSYRILVPHAKSSLWKAHSPKSLGYHQHLYTHLAAGGESDEIERWFDTAFESPAGRALQHAVTDQRLSSEDWKLLVRFLAAQDVRTPARLISSGCRTGKRTCSLLSARLRGTQFRTWRRQNAPGSLLL